MKNIFLGLRNRLLTGFERHPWDHHYQVRRRDVKPGLKVIVWLKTIHVNAAPVIWKDSQMADALVNPEKYEWFGQGSVQIGTLDMLHLTFTSSPRQIDSHWFAKAVDVKTGEEKEYSLFSLGIVPDYILKSNRDGFDPAGWNPNNHTRFDRSINR